MAQQRATLSPLPTHLIEALDSAFALKPADDPHMRTFRRNGWQRIGIILSVLWVLVGAWLAQQSVYAPVRAGHSKCISLGVTPSICKAELDKGIARKKEELQGAMLCLLSLQSLSFG